MSKNLKARLSILMLLQYFVWGAWFVTTGTYLMNTLHFNGREIGLIYGATAIAALISPFLSGLLADRLVPVERLLGIYQLLGGFILIGISFVTDFWLFYPIILLYTIIFVPTFGLSSALVFHNVTDRAREFSNIRVWGTVGWIAAGILISLMDWEEEAWPLRVAGVASLAMSAFCFSLPKTPILQSKGSSLGKILGKEAKTLLLKRSFVVFLICFVLIRVPSSFYYSFVNPFLTESGMSNAAGKMTLGQVAEVALMLSFPAVYRLLGLKWVLFLGMLAWGLRYLCFAYGEVGTSDWLLYIGILLHGATYNYTTHVGQIFIDQTVSRELRSSAQGFINFLTHGIGVLLGSFLAGAVVDQYTFADGTHLWESIFIIPGIIGLSIALLFAAFFFPKPG